MQKFSRALVKEMELADHDAPSNCTGLGDVCEAQLSGPLSERSTVKPPRKLPSCANKMMVVANRAYLKQPLSGKYILVFGILRSAGKKSHKMSQHSKTHALGDAQ